MQESGASSNIRNSSWRMTISTVVNFWSTEKCDISICMYFYDQHHFWTSSLESRRYFMDQEGFLKDDQIYFCKVLSYREVWYINLYVLGRQIWCGQNYLWTSLFVSGRFSIDQEGFLKGQQIYFCIFSSYREVSFINLYELCETNPMMQFKSLMNMIHGWHIWTSANFREPL